MAAVHFNPPDTSAAMVVAASVCVWATCTWAPMAVAYCVNNASKSGGTVGSIVLTRGIEALARKERHPAPAKASIPATHYSSRFTFHVSHFRHCLPQAQAHAQAEQAQAEREEQRQGEGRRGARGWHARRGIGRRGN